MGLTAPYANAPGSKITAAQAEPGAVGCRIASTVGTLQLVPASGTTIEVNGELVPFVDSAGVSTFAFDPLVDHSILADGTDSGILPAVNNLYGVYVSNSSATFGPKSLRLCSQFTPVYFAGFPYLDAAGNAKNWRYLGAAILDATGAFQDTTSAREVCNLYNRQPKPIILQPGYANDNAQTSYNLNTAVWARINAGTGDAATYLELAGIPGVSVQSGAEFHLALQLSGPAAVCRFGIGFDSATTPATACLVPSGAAVSVACSLFPNTAALAITTRHTVYMLGMTSGAACTIVADVPRNGAATDPPSSRLVGMVNV